VPRGAGLQRRTRRAFPIGGGSETSALLGGLSGPPLAPLPLFTWKRSAQLGTPCHVNFAIWSSLGCSRGELPSILNKDVVHKLIMALIRTLARLRNEVTTTMSGPMRERDAERLYHRSTAGKFRHLVTEEYGVAVADTICGSHVLKPLPATHVQAHQRRKSTHPMPNVPL